MHFRLKVYILNEFVFFWIHYRNYKVCALWDTVKLNNDVNFQSLYNSFNASFNVAGFLPSNFSKSSVAFSY